MRTLDFCQSLLDLSEHFETMVKRKREEQDLEGPATKHANTLQGTRISADVKNMLHLGEEKLGKFNE